MFMMVSRMKSLGTPLLLIVLVSVFTGCRTYGGYGTEEAAVEEMAQAVENYENLLAQARAVQATLEQEAGSDPALARFVEQFGAVVTGHAVLLEEHKEYLEALVGSDDYREISRVLGALIAEEKLTERQYREVIYSAMHAPDSTAQLVRAEVAPLGRYYVVPPYYEQVRQGRLGPFSELEVGVRGEEEAAMGDDTP